jgi:hypothetical protein
MANQTQRAATTQPKNIILLQLRDIKLQRRVTRAILLTNSSPTAVLYFTR